jgi:hypothetical protein
MGNNVTKKKGKKGENEAIGLYTIYSGVIYI